MSVERKPSWAALVAIAENVTGPWLYHTFRYGSSKNQVVFEPDLAQMVVCYHATLTDNVAKAKVERMVGESASSFAKLIRYIEDTLEGRTPKCKEPKPRLAPAGEVTAMSEAFRRAAEKEKTK